MSARAVLYLTTTMLVSDMNAVVGLINCSLVFPGCELAPVPCQQSKGVQQANNPAEEYNIFKSSMQRDLSYQHHQK